MTFETYIVIATAVGIFSTATLMLSAKQKKELSLLLARLTRP